MLSNTFETLTRINEEFEKGFTSASSLAKLMGCNEEGIYGAKRTFSYNPNSQTILELYPEFEPLVDKVSDLIQSLSRKLDEDSNNSQLWKTLGYCYLTLGDFPKAFSTSLRVSADQNDPTFLYALGIIYSHYKYFDNSINCFQQVLQISPNSIFSSEINFLFGIIYRKVQKYDFSLIYFQKSLDSPPNGLLPEDVQMQIAYTYQFTDRSSLSNDIYSNIYSKYPKSQSFLQQYCLYLFIQSKGINAESLRSLLSYSLNLYPNDPTFLLISSRLAMLQNDTTTAYENLISCVNYCNDAPSFWCELGTLYYRNDQINDAYIAFQKALDLNPDFFEPYLNMGLIYEQRNQYQNANQLYITAQQKFPNNPIINERIASNNSKLNNKQRPQLMCVKDTKLIPSSVEEFSEIYLMATPKLPAECFGNCEMADEFAKLSSYPKSFFK
ncbi:TPR Domain containing protein [Histomonas meleagridis]|uniref:TPR Domain containing protein n=1 Tax=Histomonas meleagridis TaxID=135588 RepID=UPI0035596922|nr:TPR Domain containing protein [Histomonas meleagridis]KAH0800803.1 TPR Domain containing protein [Histomonas meleagridis]